MVEVTIMVIQRLFPHGWLHFKPPPSIKWPPGYGFNLRGYLVGHVVGALKPSWFYDKTTGAEPPLPLCNGTAVAHHWTDICSILFGGSLGKDFVGIYRTNGYCSAVTLQYRSGLNSTGMSKLVTAKIVENKRKTTFFKSLEQRSVYT